MYQLPPVLLQHSGLAFGRPTRSHGSVRMCSHLQPDHSIPWRMVQYQQSSRGLWSCFVLQKHCRICLSVFDTRPPRSIRLSYRFKNMDGYCGRNQHPSDLLNTEPSLEHIFEPSSDTEGTLGVPQTPDRLHLQHRHHTPKLRLRHPTDLPKHLRPRSHAPISNLSHPSAHPLQHPRHRLLVLLRLSKR